MDDGPNPPHTRFSPVWWAVAAAAIVLIASTAMARPGDLAPGEEAIFAALNGAPAWVRAPLQVVQHLGLSVVVLGIAALLAVVGRWRVAATLVVAWALARGAATLLKAWVGRGRPPDFFDDVVLRQHLPADNGFPSAHSANAAALAVVVGWAWPRWRWPAAVVAVLVGLGRLVMGVHLPLDLVGGWALGVLAGLAACALTTRLAPAPADPVPSAAEIPASGR